MTKSLFSVMGGWKRPVGLWGCGLAFLLGSVMAVMASHVVLVDGVRFNDVQVIRRDAETLQIRVPYGTITIAMVLVDTIDGVPVRPKVTSPVPVPITPMPSVGQLVPAGSKRSWLPAVPDEIEPNQPMGVYVHDWRVEKWMLIATMCFGLWLMLLSAGHAWVVRQSADNPRPVRLWNLINLVLPGSGLALCAVASFWNKIEQRRSAPTRVRIPVGSASDDESTVVGNGRARIGFATSLRARQREIELVFLNWAGEPIEIRQDKNEMTGLEVAHDVLEQAILQRASDVHLEPADKGYRVRYRVDGLLQERARFDRQEGQRVLSAIKALAQIVTADKQSSLDGRFRIQAGDRDIDVRAATAVSIDGEKLVLRILDRKRGVLSLTELGMNPVMMSQFEKVVHSHSGMILATGPTGSGKTTTLYAALNKLDMQQLNVMTIEDPVEYQLAGATQISVNPRAGVTYESGLRSILRQDPDVILVGEMRDAEAATIAMRAALAGHLVLSTLHTTDAWTTIVRLEEMGVERHRIAAALLMVVGQRLVRVLCRECRELHEPDPEALEIRGISGADAKRIYRAVGCRSCDGTGYQGRTAIFELALLDDDLRQAVAEGVSQQVLQQKARQKGFKSYREDGAAKVVMGVTSLEEVLGAA